MGSVNGTGILGAAGLQLLHSEWMDQDIEFVPWLSRMRCSEATAARLLAMLGSEPLKGFLRPRETDHGLVFTLQEGIILAAKPRENRR